MGGDKMVLSGAIRRWVGGTLHGLRTGGLSDEDPFAYPVDTVR